MSLETARMPLRTAIAQLEKACGITIEIDPRSLEGTNFTSATEVLLVGAETPLHEVLTIMLSPLKLTYRVWDGSILIGENVGEIHARTYFMGDLIGVPPLSP